MQHKISLASTLLVLLLAAPSSAFNVIFPGDPILAIDEDFSVGVGSSSPDAEQALNVLDGDPATKYLNFGRTNTGFIVTPSASSIVQSFTLTTANDAEPRDPANWLLYGTNDAITSEAHSNGRMENWVEISTGDLSLPVERLTLGSVNSFSNSTSYSSYKMIFPDVKDDSNSMQVADAAFYSSMDGSGANILAPGNFIIPVRDIDETTILTSGYPAAENPPLAIDRNVNTKYLNTGGPNSGFIVTPSYGATAVTGFQITTANDVEGRDPDAWVLYGTNDEVTTPDNGTGLDAENWTEIDSGTLALPTERFAAGDVVPVNNTAGEFASYKMVFTSLKDDANTLMQIAEVSLLAADDAVLEVNRQTGEVVLRATSDINVASYELQSQSSGGLDADNWSSIASTGADPNDTWEETSATSTLLAESDAAGGSDDGFSLANGATLNLGDVWRALPTSFEDVVIDARDADGNRIGIGTEYTGAVIPFGDYSGNGTIGPEDWSFFAAGFGGNYDGLSAAAAYLGGDLDGDFDSDINDFNVFVALAGGAEVLFGAPVPEPSSIVLLSLAGVAGLCFSRRRFRAAPLVVATLAAATAVSTAQAQTFTNVGGAPTTVSIPAEGQENENVDSGPINFFDDTFLDDPDTIDGELFLLDYNDPNLEGGPYLQYAGLGADPKTVFFDYGSSVTANWFAYSQRSGADPTADRVGTFEFWFSNSSFNDTVPTSEPDAVVELLPNDQRLLDSALRPYSLEGDHSGRYVAMRLTVADISADRPTNNIGGHEFRLLSGPGDVVLEIDRGTGAMTLRNNLAGAQDIEMKAITIESPTGGLNADGFNGVGGVSAAFPAGDGSGNGWEVGGGSNAARLAEGYYSFGLGSTLAAGTTGLSLGNGYNPLSLSEDVELYWSNIDGNVFDAQVTYVGTAPDFLVGDYNDNGVVDAADYTVWRDALGADTELANDATPGSVDELDFARWKAHFGESSAAAVAGAAVPEPGALLLGLIGLVGLFAARRRAAC